MVDVLIAGVMTTKLSNVFIDACAALVEVSFSDAEIVVVATAVVALTFITPIPFAVDVLPGMVVGVLFDVLTAVTDSNNLCCFV